MASEKNIGCMEDEALKRKERLKALKRKHDETDKEGDKSEYVSTEGLASLPRLVWFVTYVRILLIVHNNMFLNL